MVWAIAAAIAVSYAAFALAPPDLRNWADFRFALVPERFHATSPYRFDHWYEALAPLIGHAFLHVGWWHAAVNGFFFFLTARYPAARLGPWRFLALFFISSIGGAAAFLALNWNEQAIAVGASGALCGVFSAYFLSARATWRESLADARVRNQYITIVVINVVLMGIAAEMNVFPIAWEGHLGGFVGGALAWIALDPRPRRGS